MKKILTLLVMTSLSWNVFALDSTQALDKFRTDLSHIREKLQAGKMSAQQADILLAALQVRQNNVLIAQNAEILKGLTHESK